MWSCSTWTTLISFSYVSLLLAQSLRSYDSATLSQDLAGIDVGQVYFFAAEVNLPGMVNSGNCLIFFSAGAETLVLHSYNMNAQHGLIFASGTFASAPSGLDLTVTCSDTSGNPTDLWASLDNVQLSVYDPSVGTDLIPQSPGPSDGLENSDFKSGTLSPWAPTQYGQAVYFAVIEGSATMTYSQIDAGFSQSWFSQTLQKPVEIGQMFRIQADVYFNIPNAGTKCTAQIWTGGPVAWSVQNVARSRSFTVDVSVTLNQESTIFNLFGSCTGTGATTSISFDNVYLTLES
jgi:hypothetical protein